MCGICGKLTFDGQPVDRVQLSTMRDLMTHRGPDDSGIFLQGPVGLGHRRLSIIDLSGGHQPIANEDGTVTVIFNGEIYNFESLRQELVARGHTLKTRSDTEVIVHLYEELGPLCVQRMRGMFTFALWDARRQRLMLARDRMGIKPLYYARTGNALVFASEIKALLREPGLPVEIDPRGLRRYLVYRHPYGRGTLFKGIEQLPPAHYLLATPNGVSVRRYWDVPERPQEDTSAYAEGFLPLLEEAVKLRMISDVPLGSFLSGGIDSSVVTALMARHTNTLRTFSVGFVPGEENELHWARQAAEQAGAEHHEFLLRSEDFFSLLGKLVWHNDEPLTFAAGIPLYLLSRESKRVATVMLAGEGADELFGGYANNVRAYRLTRIARRMPQALHRLLAVLPLPARARRLASRAAQDETTLIQSSFRLHDHQAMTAASRIPLPGAEEDDDALRKEIGFETREGSFLDRLLYFQLQTYLVALLMKQDKMSMAASIESRVPYLDHHLVELAFTLPDEHKICGNQGKVLLRRAAKGLVPDGIITRPKRGFPVPIAQWFRQPGNPFMETLLDSETLANGFLDAGHVKRSVARFRAGHDNSQELWAMLNLELWRREFLLHVKSERQMAVA
jgi:asparagine synthase (glutamine-hydrolysing)